MIFHGSRCTRDHVLTSIFSVFHMSRFRKKAFHVSRLRPLSDPQLIALLTRKKEKKNQSGFSVNLQYLKHCGQVVYEENK
jgi:hypothetical protein